MSKIREVLSFIKWQIRQWKWHDYLWFTACGMIGADFADKGNVFFAGVFIALVMMLGTMFKWQWDSWKREREDLLKTIKDGK